MKGGTGRLPTPKFTVKRTGRDDGRDPGLYKFLQYLSPDVYM